MSKKFNYSGSGIKGGMMKIGKNDVNKIVKICNFFQDFKLKYNDDGIFDLSKDVEISIDRLLALIEEIRGNYGRIQKN